MTDATQAEQREALRNDTYLRRAMNDASDEAGGRFAKTTKTTVNGAAPTVEYPAAAGPWSSDCTQVPPEPPLGYSIEAHEPVGEAFEVERSLASLGEVEAPAGVVASSAAVEIA